MENKTAVKCSSKEQSQQVISYVRKGVDEYTCSYSERCINLEDGCHAGEEYYKNAGYKIISFEDFEKEYLGKPPKTEFIPGKWYKETMYEWYAKFLKIGSRDNFVSSERIMTSGYGENEYGFEPSKTYNWILLEDLSEIQQYLPEGHPDKIKEKVMNKLIIGEYYTVDGWIFIHVDPVNYKCNNTALTSNTNKYFNGDAHISSINSSKRAKLATFEEKIWLDCCIKAGKFVPEDEALKQKQKVNPNTDFVFIPGNIYVGYWENSNRVIFKPHSVYLDKDCDMIMCDNSYHFKSNGCCTADNILFRDATQEEKDWLEACIIAGITLTKEEALKPKEMELEEGKWYEGITSEKNKWIFKFRSKREEEGYNSYIDCKVSSGAIYRNGWNCYTNIKPANMEEVYKHFPEERPKEEKTMEEVKYKSWSIKYTPEFTEDIFNHLIKWCEPKIDGKKTFWRKYKIDKSYLDFTNNKFFVFYTYIGVDNNTQGNPLISLNELISIIGYNKQEKPMEKEENWIPKVGEWGIILTSGWGEGESYIGKAYKITKVSMPGTWGNNYCDITINNSCRPLIDSEGKQVVRKALPEEIPSEVPEYVECIKQYTGQFTVGKVYKTAEDSTKEHYRFEKDDKNSANGWSSTCFKPSTKEAYDRQQNTPKMEENDDWCVLRTKENQEVIIKWGDTKNQCWIGSGTYYGIDDGVGSCKGRSWGKLLSTEEFYKKIGHKVTKQYSSGSISTDDDLKVGDKVRAIDQTHSWGSVKKGDIGIVKEAKDDFYTVDFPAQNSWNGRRRCFEKIIEESNISKENNLLEEAKRRYPIGTIVNSLGGCKNQRISTINPYLVEDIDGVRFDENTLVYTKGKWAEIVSEGKKYPVTPDNAYKEVLQAQAVIQPVLKSLEENDERIDSSINFISSVSNKLVLEEV